MTYLPPALDGLEEEWKGLDKAEKERGIFRMNDSAQERASQLIERYEFGTAIRIAAAECARLERNRRFVHAKEEGRVRAGKLNDINNSKADSEAYNIHAAGFAILRALLRNALPPYLHNNEYPFASALEARAIAEKEKR